MTKSTISNRIILRNLSRDAGTRTTDVQPLALREDTTMENCLALTQVETDVDDTSPVKAMDGKCACPERSVPRPNTADRIK